MDQDAYVAEIIVRERLREARAEAQRAVLVAALRPSLSRRLGTVLRRLRVPAWRRRAGLASAAPLR